MSLMTIPPDLIYTELAQRKGIVGSVKRSPEFAKQNEILDDVSRWKALNCTRRGAKSTTEVMSHVEVCQKYPKSRTLYMGLTLDSVSEIAWDIFKELNEKNKLGLKFNETKKIIYYPNGSRTRLFGLDASKRQLAKVLGQKLRKVSIDEAGSITIDLEDFCFQKIRPALIDLAPNSWLTLLGTCENIPNTYFQRVTEGKCVNFDWKVHKWTTYDNPFLRKQWDAEIKEMLEKNPLVKETSKFKTHYGNEWVSDDDLLIIPSNRMIFEDTLPRLGPTGKPIKDWFYILAVDLGFNDASAYTVIATSWQLDHSYVVDNFKSGEQDFTDVSNTIKEFKKKYEIGATIVDGANKQGIAEMKKRLGLPELEIAEKTGKAIYLKLLRDDVIQGKLRFIKSKTDDLKKEWDSLMWKNSDKQDEDPRCQNHLSDSTLYGWRKTFADRPKDVPKPPKEDEPEYEDYLEEQIEQQALDEIQNEEDTYGTPEDDGYF